MRQAVTTAVSQLDSLFAGGFGIEIVECAGQWLRWTVSHIAADQNGQSCFEFFKGYQ